MDSHPIGQVKGDYPPIAIPGPMDNIKIKNRFDNMLIITPLEHLFFKKNMKENAIYYFS